MLVCAEWLGARLQSWIMQVRVLSLAKNKIRATMTFVCTHCRNEYPRISTTEEVVKQFKKWYPRADLSSAKLVCEKCYGIALRVLELRLEHQNWINYAMNN